MSEAGRANLSASPPETVGLQSGDERLMTAARSFSPVAVWHYSDYQITCGSSWLRAEFCGKTVIHLRGHEQIDQLGALLSGSISHDGEYGNYTINGSVAELTLVGPRALKISSSGEGFLNTATLLCNGKVCCLEVTDFADLGLYISIMTGRRMLQRLHNHGRQLEVLPQEKGGIRVSWQPAFQEAITLDFTQAEAKKLQQALLAIIATTDPGLMLVAPYVGGVLNLYGAAANAWVQIDLCDGLHENIELGKSCALRLAAEIKLILQAGQC